MNKVELIGRTTRDIEVKSLKSGKKVAIFSVAVNRGETTIFVNCEAWEKTAQNLADFVRKGDQVGIVGHLVADSYEKNGEQIVQLKVVVDELTLLANKR